MSKMKIIRTTNAGVFFGKLELYLPETRTAKLTDARRLWYWAGAASLSQLAVEGVKRPLDCKFAIPINVTVTEVIEIIDVTKDAEKSIKEVPIWRV